MEGPASITFLAAWGTWALLHLQFVSYVHVSDEAGTAIALSLLQELRNPSGGAQRPSFCTQLRVYQRAFLQLLGQAGGFST